MNKPRNAWIAGLLSVLTIGLGHIYAGVGRKGLIFLFVPQAIFFSALVLPVIIAPNIIGLGCSAVVFLLLMGDNRDESNDSRYFGFVKKAMIRGKAHLIYWSWDGINFNVRWNRIGKRI